MTNASPLHSKLLYGAKPLVAADGVQKAVVKVRLRDCDDNPVVGRQTQLVASRNDVVIDQPGLTDANGLALGYVSTTTPGPVNITAQVLPPTP
jgi:hypothetical protein